MLELPSPKQQYYINRCVFETKISKVGPFLIHGHKRKPKMNKKKRKEK